MRDPRPRRRIPAPLSSLSGSLSSMPQPSRAGGEHTHKRPYRRSSTLTGRGGMGEVYYAAQQRSTDSSISKVALKVLTRPTCGRPPSSIDFQQERRVLAHLSDPHIAGHPPRQHHHRRPAVAGVAIRGWRPAHHGHA